MSQSNVKPFKINAKVQWKWLGGLIGGTVKEVHFTPITKMLKGKKIVRNGSPQRPAYLVQSEAGNFALKLHSELILQEKKAAPRRGNGPNLNITKIKA